MTARDGRSYSLEIGSIKIESISKEGLPRPDSLAFEFSITRDKTPEPNMAEFKIYNLSPAHRAELGKSEQTVRFRAGYRDDTDLLFYGVLNAAFSQYENDRSVMTHLRAGDGQSQLVTSKVSKSFAKGALISDVFETLAKALGVEQGNLKQYSKTAATKAGLILPHAIAFSGDTSAAMSSLCSSLGITWCVSNGKLEVVPEGVATSQGPLITPETGLIGSPQAEPKGVYTFQCLLMPGVIPLSQVQIKSEGLNATLILSNTRHYGHTHTGSWMIDAKGSISK